MVSESPILVKIGDFGLAKLVRTGTAFRSRGGTMNYIAPEVEIDPNRDTSVYTNAIDIWSIGCITHELLTQVVPFRGNIELTRYCSCPKLPRESMLTKNVSQKGIEFVERTLAYPPEHRIGAKEALDSEWLLPECGVAAGLETDISSEVMAKPRIVVGVDFGIFPLRFKVGKEGILTSNPRSDLLGYGLDVDSSARHGDRDRWLAVPRDALHVQCAHRDLIPGRQYLGLYLGL